MSKPWKDRLEITNTTKRVRAIYNRFFFFFYCFFFYTKIVPRERPATARRADVVGIPPIF